MCAVSMISKHYMDQYQDAYKFPETKWPDFSELIRKAKLYDEMTQQKDCPDPEKQAWVDAVNKKFKGTE